MDEMCELNFKLKSIFTPKYLKPWATKIEELLIVRLTRAKSLLELGRINSACDFEGFTVSLLAFNHGDTTQVIIHFINYYR